MELFKHIVLVLTYNHEKYIDEALNSILNQTQKPYKVIISDDHSNDNTYEKILKYKKAYPNLFEIFRNKTNKGILENIDFLRKYRGEGDIFSFCSGDDLLDLTCLENINNGFISNSINPKVTSSIVVTNSYIKNLNTSKLSLFNNFRERNLNSFKKVIRSSLSFRSVGFSRALFFRIKTELDYRNFFPNLGLGYDYLVCIDEVLLSEKIIYINKPGSIYRTNVGITSVKGNNFWNGLVNTIEVAQKIYKAKLDKKDNLFLIFLKKAYLFKSKSTIKNWLVLVFYYLLNINNFYPNNPFINNIRMLFPDKIIYRIKNLLGYNK
jgi:glycosyltransferase involved in cell wall biosynthesis